uniref:Uncharacterized protein n=1 Tax=Eutreptiella gymnastica TaxID=73025 RepID=A0A7S1NNB5_9EUGL
MASCPHTPQAVNLGPKIVKLCFLPILDCKTGLRRPVWYIWPIFTLQKYTFALISFGVSQDSNELKMELNVDPKSDCPKMTSGIFFARCFHKRFEPIFNPQEQTFGSVVG